MDTPADALRCHRRALRWQGYEVTRCIELPTAFCRVQEDLTWVDLGHFPYPSHWGCHKPFIPGVVAQSREQPAFQRAPATKRA